MYLVYQFFLTLYSKQKTNFLKRPVSMSRRPIKRRSVSVGNLYPSIFFVLKNWHFKITFAVRLEVSPVSERPRHISDNYANGLFVEHLVDSAELRNVRRVSRFVPFV